MFDQLIDKLKKDKSSWEKFRNLFVEREITAKTI
jgi:hypothetical protein